MTPRDRIGRWSPEEEPEPEPAEETDTGPEDESDGHGSLAAGMSVGILAGAGIVATAIRYPIVWLIPVVLGIVWIVANERRLKIDNPSPTAPDPAPPREEGPGEGPWPGVSRVDRIGGDAGYIIHPQPIPATQTETESTPCAQTEPPDETPCGSPWTTSARAMWLRPGTGKRW